MMKKLFTFLLLSIFCTSSFFASAQKHSSWSRYDTSGFFTKDSIHRKGYTLIFINKDSAFSPAEKERLIKTFFKVYPKEAKKFNPNTEKKVTFIIDPHYKGVAATGNAVTRFNPEWFKDHPEDVDVVTHEVMHIVQNYHSGHVPGWLTEGIADYVRYTFGVNNKAAKWTLPNYNAKQSYKNAYRITARFLLWVRKNTDKDIVKHLDASLRNGTYETSLWEKLTGSTLDQLWSDYGKNSELRLHYR